MPEPWDDAGLTYNGGTNQFTAFTPAFDGSLVDLESSDIYHNNMLSTVQYFVDSLGVAENAKPNKEGIRASIDNLDVVFEQVSQTRSQIGARQNTLEAVKTSNEDFELFAKKSLSELEDLDYAEAITRFQQQQMSLQAGQQAFGRVAGLSLFNHI
jgi:flagellar hook-associated protein 3 FlgL